MILRAMMTSANVELPRLLATAIPLGDQSNPRVYVSFRGRIEGRRYQAYLQVGRYMHLIITAAHLRLYSLDISAAAPRWNQKGQYPH
jgi:hypothetical protein